MVEPLKIGFAKPVGAKRHHLFKLNGSRSLCGRVKTQGELKPMLDPDKILKLSPGDCQHCVQVFNAVREEHHVNKNTPGAGGTE